jgi:hypothetical protein
MFNRLGRWIGWGIFAFFFLPMLWILVSGRGYWGDWLSAFSFLFSALFFHPRFSALFFKKAQRDPELLLRKAFSFGLLFFFLGLGILMLHMKMALSDRTF